MTDSEQIFQAIRGLPVRERLRIVERVVHDIADAPGAEPVVSSAVEASSLLGLFANEPELMDEEEELVVSMQGTWKQAREMGRDEGRTRRPCGDTTHERILSKKDPGRLERWLERAIVAASVAEVIDEPSST